MQEQTYTLIVDFSVKGDLAYLSHQETLKMFQRSLIRAAIPLVFSSGFNPHPQLSVPLPRSVSVQSLRDRLCAAVHFGEFPVPENFGIRIQQQLPDGCVVQQVRCQLGRCSFQPQGVDYRFCLKPLTEAAFIEHLDRCRQQVLDKSCIPIQRYWAKKGRYKQFDISPYVQALHVRERSIDVSCRISSLGTVRVDELMQWLNVDPEYLSEPVIRTHIQWQQN